MGWREWRRAERPLLHVALDEGTGPAVVLVHGIASSWVTFEHVVPLLSSSHRVVAVDLLGFGGSPAPESASYTLEEHVAALHRTLRRRLGWRTRFTLLGHSMGSLIATRYAVRHPRQLDQLVLVSPPVYLPPEAFSDPVHRAQMGLYLKAYEFLRTNPGFTMRVAAQLAAISPIRGVLDVSERNWRAFTLSLKNSIEAQTTTITDLANVRVPVDLVYGTFDPFLMPPALRIAEQLRGVTTYRVEAADHLIRPVLAKVVADAVLDRVGQASA